MLSIAILMIVIVSALSITEQASALEKKRDFHISKVTIPDTGSYEGQGAGFDASSAGNVIVRTNIAENKIKSIEVLVHRELNGDQQLLNFEKTAKLIIDKILSTQNPNISEEEVKDIIKDLIKDMQPIPKKSMYPGRKRHCAGRFKFSDCKP